MSGPTDRRGVRRARARTRYGSGSSGEGWLEEGSHKERKLDSGVLFLVDGGMHDE